MKNWFNLSTEEVEKKLESSKTVGLLDEEVNKRKVEYGLNELKSAKKHLYL